MKKLLSIAAVSISLLALSSPGQAAGTATFTVDATLSSACTMAAFSGNINFGTYTAFATAVTPAAITSAVTCTRTLTGVTAVFDDNGTTQTSAAAGATPTAEGLLSNGLRYTMTSSLGSFTAGTAATGGSGGDVGTGQTATFTVNATLPSQAGTCSAGSCAATQQTRTVTLNF